VALGLFSLSLTHLSACTRPDPGPEPNPAGGGGSSSTGETGGSPIDFGGETSVTGGAPSTNTGGAPSTNTGGAPSTNTGGAPSTNTGGAPSTNTGGAPSTTTGGTTSVVTDTLPAASVFADGQVVEYRFTLDPSDWYQLEEYGNAEEYLPAELNLSGSIVGSQSLGSVGLRHKGAWTLHHCWDDFGGIRSHAAECAKLSYKIKFNEYKSGTRYEGLKQLNLHAAAGDATKLREMLAYSTFRDFGVDTSRTAPAKLYINDEFMGLFIAVEEIDGRYTKFHYPEGGNGNLYKEVWPRTGLANEYFIGGLKTNEDKPNVSDIQAFSAAIGASSKETFSTDMQPWFDMDALLRYIAVDRASKNWDGIMAFYTPSSPHNFFWYHDDGVNGKFHLIPWDMDNTFWEFDPYMAPEQWVTADPVPNWNVQPASCDPISVWSPDSGTRITPPGCDPLLRLLASTQWEKFVSLGQELINGPLQHKKLLAKISHWSSIIGPIIAEDPYVDLQTWRQERDQFNNTLKQAIVDFDAFLKEGYIVQEPLPTLPEPTDAELVAPISETGILLDRVNNYEFIGSATSNPPVGIYWYGDGSVSGIPTWNNDAPESGTADLRFDFNFTRISGTWNEWVNLAVPTEGYQELDISGYTQISFTLRTDSTRTVRVRLDSPAYDDVFGGAWREFGTEFSVTTTPTTYKMRLSSLYYPDWAKTAWTGTSAGWSTSDSEALQVLLQRFNGLIFIPQATTSSDGELATETDDGFIQIDNIYFQ
jgi:spore coat protein H